MSVSPINREAWLQERRKGIGGSDAAALLGLNPYKTPYVLWADKTGRLPEAPDNEAMRQGRDLEDYVAQRFMEESGKKVRRKNSISYSKQYPWALANIDRVVINEDAGLECKTTSVLNLKRYKNGEYPVEFYCQCMHYMAVTGSKKWYLAVLVFGRDFMIYEIERDEEEITALMEAEKHFWEEYVGKDVPPPMDGQAATSEAIRTIYADSVDGAPLDLFGHGGDAEAYTLISKQIKVMEAERKRYKQKLQEAMGKNEVGFCGEYEVVWKKIDSKRPDPKLIFADHPELNQAKYYRTSSSRRFAVKTRKEG